MLSRRLATADNDLFGLFLPTVSKPSTAAVRCLATLISRFDLPETHIPEYLAHVMDVDKLNAKHPLRHILLQWLLPSAEDTDTASSPDTDESLLARVVTSLIRRKVTLDFTFCPTTSSETEAFGDFERIYLKCNIALETDSVTSKPTEVRAKTTAKNNLKLESLETVLCELLRGCCVRVAETTSTEVLKNTQDIHVVFISINVFLEFADE